MPKKCKFILILVLPISAGSAYAEMANDLSKFNKHLDNEVLEFAYRQKLTSSNNQLSIVKPSFYPKFMNCEDISFESLQTKRQHENLSISIKCNKPKIFKARINLRVKHPSDYYVSKKFISKGESIDTTLLSKEHDFNPQKISNRINKLKDLTNYVATRDIEIGNPIMKNDVRPIIAIRRSERVNVTLSKSGFVISTSGKSLGNARLGDSVLIQLDNNKTIEGIAVDKSTVEIKN